MDGGRIDKWLWAARFFKTRSLATEAINGGRVELNEVRSKPAKEVKVGDLVRVSIGETALTVVVRALSDKRGPASVAQTLYEETDDSRERREAHAALRRMAPSPGVGLHGRPTKRDRRRIEAIRDNLRGGPRE